MDGFNGCPSFFYGRKNKQRWVKGGYKLIEEIPQDSENPLAEGPVGFVFVYVI